MEKTPDPAGTHRKSPDHGSSIPVGKFWIFSIDFRPVSGGKAQESDRNAPEKSRKFPAEYCFHDPVTSSVFLLELSRIL